LYTLITFEFPAPVKADVVTLYFILQIMATFLVRDVYILLYVLRRLLESHGLLLIFSTGVLKMVIIWVISCLLKRLLNGNM